MIECPYCMKKLATQRGLSGHVGSVHQEEILQAMEIMDSTTPNVNLRSPQPTPQPAIMPVTASDTMQQMLQNQAMALQMMQMQQMMKDMRKQDQVQTDEFDKIDKLIQLSDVLADRGLQQSEDNSMISEAIGAILPKLLGKDQEPEKDFQTGFPTFPAQAPDLQQQNLTRYEEVMKNAGRNSVHEDRRPVETAQSEPEINKQPSDRHSPGTKKPKVLKKKKSKT